MGCSQPAAPRCRAKSHGIRNPHFRLNLSKNSDIKYRQFEDAIKKEFIKKQGTRTEVPEKDIAIKQGGFYLPDHARYQLLRDLPENENHAAKLKSAMQAIEDGLDRKGFKNVLPQDEYFKLNESDKTLIKTLLKTFDDIPNNASGDIVRRIFKNKSRDCRI